MQKQEQKNNTLDTAKAYRRKTSSYCKYCRVGVQKTEQAGAKGSPKMSSSSQHMPSNEDKEVEIQEFHIY